MFFNSYFAPVRLFSYIFFLQTTANNETYNCCKMIFTAEPKPCMIIIYRSVF